MRRLFIVGAILGAACLFACGDDKSSPTSASPSTTQTRIIAIEGSVVDFGSVQLGTSFDRTLRIFNQGNAVLTLNGMSGPCTSAFKVSGANTTVSPGSSVVVTLTFTPTNTQSCNGTLSITSDATSGRGTIPVNAIGTLDGVPLWSRSGTGDKYSVGTAAQFTMPTYISHVRVRATVASSCENFAVYVAGRLFINMILGTCSVADATSVDATYATTGGDVEVNMADHVSWIFTEVR